MTRSFIVRHKVRSNFTTVPNELVQDSRLSWKALGLLIYLVHLPENFQLHLYNLARARPGLNGRDSTRSALRELEQCGYVTIERERSNSGRWGGTCWYVSSIPDIPAPQRNQPPAQD